jgi:VanZ family protein
MAAVIVGVADELMQSFNPGRVVGLGDIAADATGALLVVATLAVLRERMRLSGMQGVGD